MSSQLSARRHSTVRPAALPVRPSEAAGLLGVILLMAAFVSPEGLRVFLSAAGLMGIAGFRLAATRNGWARRGAARS